ncbi:uncharacterized protein [Primulina eburnea]|uniref:uncharacterized protein isoform X2 n=1 Tax=Primulina eburnea TaxID=1245227 RepID=UPI003C6C936C
MAQFRQSGGISGARNGVTSGHVSIAVRHSHHHQHRRSKTSQGYKLSTGFGGGETNINQIQDDEMENDMGFLMNITQIPKLEELKFGNGSVAHDRDSRYWDKDDRRRDEDYSEEELEQTQDDSVDNHEVKDHDKKSLSDKPSKVLDHRGNSLYNEAGRNELKMYEAEYEASLKSIGESMDVNDSSKQQFGNSNGEKHRALEADEEYDDGIDIHDDQMEEYDNTAHNSKDQSTASKPHSINTGESFLDHHARNKKQEVIENVDSGSADLFTEESLLHSQHPKVNTNPENITFLEDHPVRKLVPERHSGSKKKPKRRKFSGSCEMKLLDSSSLLVEPVQSRKFARFSLQYTEIEEKIIENEKWESRFAGHQTLIEREESFIAHDQRINCGFVKGPKGSPSTGFDLAEDDAKYISSCHIAVMSCVFGNSDRLRSPMGRTVSRASRKNVCFVMFMDELTLQALSTEGQTPDMMGFIGLWRIVVVKNLPYTDMRRVGKIPKFLPHRLFPSARYSIWLDSKLRLQLDPLVILEYFLWRKDHEYAISNHYDRHCLWEEVAQNKKLNKYNHSVIDEQFAFYQADRMKRFNASDPDKLLPSNVPEGSFIVRAHTPMSNLFSCLWFNEVDRFTPRDQLSFAYTYHKLRRKNPDKPFYFNMFKDCERRKISKLYHHRLEEKRNIPQIEMG